MLTIANEIAIEVKANANGKEFRQIRYKLLSVFLLITYQVVVVGCVDILRMNLGRRR